MLVCSPQFYFLQTAMYENPFLYLATVILYMRMRSSLVVRASDGQPVAVNSQPVATVLSSIPASVGTVESEGRQIKQC